MVILNLQIEIICVLCNMKTTILISDEFGMVQNAEEQYLRDIGYKRHAFNVLVSSKIGLIRDVPDTRNKLYV